MRAVELGMFNYILVILPLGRWLVELEAGLGYNRTLISKMYK